MLYKSYGLGAPCAFWWLAVLLWVLHPIAGHADVIVFEGAAGTTTGELLEGVANIWATNQVQEIAGLEIRARTTDPNHTLNANSGYFGINSDIAGENLQAFDVGEAMQVSFDRDIRINGLDFNLFDTGEEFTLIVDGLDSVDIQYDNLANKTSDIYVFSTGIVISANTMLEFRTATGSIGLDAIDVDVIPEPAVLSLVGLSGGCLFVMRRLRK